MTPTTSFTLTVDAIFMEDEVPDQWKNFIQINADYAKK